MPVLPTRCVCVYIYIRVCTVGSSIGQESRSRPCPVAASVISIPGILFTRLSHSRSLWTLPPPPSPLSARITARHVPLRAGRRPAFTWKWPNRIKTNPDPRAAESRSRTLSPGCALSLARPETSFKLPEIAANCSVPGVS